ncbi:MAG: hypothetical protein U5M50_14920 [Sphingobium sp.]|nr:hypothetical protein [Sphingobium sp.]
MLKAAILMGAGLALLSGCSAQSPDNQAFADHEAEANGAIRCALGGATQYELRCATERAVGPKGAQLVIRHPDGGFRRFNILTNGRGVESADGSQPATVAMAGKNYLSVSVASDRYLLPVTIRHQPKP